MKETREAREMEREMADMNAPPMPSDSEPMDGHSERMILSHEPEPGYPKIFVAVLVAAVIHLAFIFVRSLH